MRAGDQAEPGPARHAEQPGRGCRRALGVLIATVGQFLGQFLPATPVISSFDPRQPTLGSPCAADILSFQVAPREPHGVQGVAGSNPAVPIAEVLV